MNRLDRAIQDFEDETLDLTMGERITILRTALLEASFDRLKQANKAGKKSPEGEELERKQVESLKHFERIEKMYFAQIRQNKLTGKAQDDGMDKEFLQKIKSEKGSMGDIVRDLKPSAN